MRLHHPSYLVYDCFFILSPHTSEMASWATFRTEITTWLTSQPGYSSLIMITNQIRPDPKFIRGCSSPNRTNRFDEGSCYAAKLRIMRECHRSSGDARARRMAG